MFYVKYFNYDVVSSYENTTLDIFLFLMSISFLVYFFGDLLKVMRYADKETVTQGVIPRNIGTERSQIQLLLSTPRGNSWQRMKWFSLGLQRNF